MLLWKEAKTRFLLKGRKTKISERKKDKWRVGEGRRKERKRGRKEGSIRPLRRNSSLPKPRQKTAGPLGGGKNPIPARKLVSSQNPAAQGSQGQETGEVSTRQGSLKGRTKAPGTGMLWGGGGAGRRRGGAGKGTPCGDRRASGLNEMPLKGSGANGQDLSLHFTHSSRQQHSRRQRPSLSYPGFSILLTC